MFARKNVWPKASWHVEGKPLERVDAFKYLGVMMHGSSGIGKTVDHRLGCMSWAQSAVYQRMKQLGLHQEVMLMTDYSEWMVGDAVEQHGYTTPAYLRAGCHKHMKRALTRLRLSNAPIAVNTQSYAIPYSDRVCSRCNSMALDNEQHMLP